MAKQKLVCKIALPIEYAFFIATVGGGGEVFTTFVMVKVRYGPPSSPKLGASHKN